MERLALHGTPLSHFTRKIRILLAELGVDYEFVRAPSVLAPTSASYAENPLLRVPTLVVGETRVFDSDHIARYLVSKLDPNDRFGVHSERVEDMNRVAVTHGIMDNVVVLLLAKRGGLSDLDGVAYFRKLVSAIAGGLTWLDAHVDLDDANFDYGDIVLVCMWQHLEYYGVVPGLDAYPRIAARVARFAARPSVAATTPSASLAEATAAGWKPG